MKTIGIIPNIEKDIGLKYTKILIDSIRNCGGKVCLTTQVANEFGIESKCGDDEAVYEGSQMVICLGGDGTFLKVARRVYKKEIPILGINLGSLGFLTEVDKNDIESIITQIMQGQYEIEERMMLETKVIKDGNILVKDVALNDVVISRAALSRILHVKTYINNVFVDMFPGDGVIVSSPTGSTAYTLSAGGPIVEPHIKDLIIVTPICPHILYSRSFITAGDRAVSVVIGEDYTHEAMVTIDGQEGYEIRGGDSVEIKRSDYTIKLIKTHSRNFFNILRTKIYDRGEILRKDEIQQTCKDFGDN